MHDAMTQSTTINRGWRHQVVWRPERKTEEYRRLKEPPFAALSRRAYERGFSFVERISIRGSVGRFLPGLYFLFMNTEDIR